MLIKLSYIWTCLLIHAETDDRNSPCPFRAMLSVGSHHIWGETPSSYCLNTFDVSVHEDLAWNFSRSWSAQCTDWLTFGLYHVLLEWFQSSRPQTWPVTGGHNLIAMIHPDSDAIMQAGLRRGLGTQHWCYLLAGSTPGVDVAQAHIWGGGWTLGQIIKRMKTKAITFLDCLSQALAIKSRLI